jgi:hypothetical protein
MYMHRKGHPQKCLCLRWPFCCHFHTHSHSDISPLNPLLLFLKIIFPVGQLPFWYWFHWTKYIYMPFFFFPHHFFYCFLKSLVMWVSFFFVNRKFEFKYYYTVALSSGAKKNKCCNRPFISFSAPPPLLHSFLFDILVLPLKAELWTLFCQVSTSIGLLP